MEQCPRYKKADEACQKISMMSVVFTAGAEFVLGMVTKIYRCGVSDGL